MNLSYSSTAMGFVVILALLSAPPRATVIYLGQTGTNSAYNIVAADGTTPADDDVIIEVDFKYPDEAATPFANRLALSITARLEGTLGGGVLASTSNPAIVFSLSVGEDVNGFFDVEIRDRTTSGTTGNSIDKGNNVLAFDHQWHTLRCTVSGSQAAMHLDDAPIASGALSAGATGEYFSISQRVVSVTDPAVNLRIDNVRVNGVVIDDFESRVPGDPLSADSMPWIDGFATTGDTNASRPWLWRVEGSGGDPTTGVCYLDLGPQVRLANEHLSMTLDKANAEILQLSIDGIEPIDGLNNTRGYWQYHGEGTGTSPLGDAFAVTTHTAVMVDVAVTRRLAIDQFPFDVELHTVLRAGERGFYQYAITHYDPAQNPTAVMGQFDSILRLNPGIYKDQIVDDERQAVMPLPEEVTDEREVIDATYRLFDGSIYTKYQWSTLEGEHHVHGMTGNGHGAWIIQASNEYMNGGPTNQENTVHQSDTSPVLLRLLQGGHYGSGSQNFTVQDGEWKKIYGPWFSYFNTGDSRAAMWADAKVHAESIVAQWPFQWLDHPLYPRHRSTVAGRLVISDGSSPENAWVILAQPEGGDIPTWQQQGKRYIFWARADSAGNFVIENVRAGDYTLYAIVDGVLDEFRLDGVTVDDPAELLGDLVWTPLTHGRLLWQIGIPDRTAAEFLHGDDFRTFGNWNLFPQDFPGGVNYVVGRSNWATDWNYAHVAVEVSTGTYQAVPWNVHFRFDGPTPQSATLTVARAAARDARLGAQLNGTTILPDFSMVNDSAIPRLGIRGLYQRFMVPFDPALLVPGTNTLTLRQTRTGEFNGTMYDAIRLEIEPANSAQPAWGSME